MARRERGIIGKLTVFVLALLALVGLVAMTLSVVNPSIDPRRFIWTSFLGLAFWEILAFNVSVFFALLLPRSRMALISVFALLVSVPGIKKSFSFGHPATDEALIRVMSYNVHHFNHIDSETESDEFASQIIEKVRELNPDVLCCQEFDAYEKGVSRKKGIENFAQSAGFQHVYYNKKQNFGGNVIFSKYPLGKVSDSTVLGKEITSGTMVAVDAGAKGKFYLANLHLISYNITDKEIDILMNSSDRRSQIDTVSTSVAKKLKCAFEKRSDEIAEVMASMSLFEGPVIICGDFNDTPLSYTYKQMQNAGFVDTFTKVGRGIKPTYAGELPLLRIDYVWANDKVKPLDFKRLRYKASDHYPIMLDFSIQK